MSTELETIDPGSVPQRKLYTGAKIPAVGLGTFGSDRFTADQIAEAVLRSRTDRISSFRLRSRVWK